MDQEPDVIFPQDTQDLMRSIVVRDMDVRLKDLTELVALQETELAVLWLALIGLGFYVVIKEHRGTIKA